MNAKLPLDPRIVANCLLDVAWEFGFSVTHLKLQKVLYFLELEYLKANKEPLISGDFVAWKHGPVHPQIWNTFKVCGPNEIRHHAYGIDLLSGEHRNLPKIEDRDIKRFVFFKGGELLQRNAYELVHQSHIRGGAWDVVTQRNGGQRVYGSRISRELMVSRRNTGPVATGEGDVSGEILDEYPPSGN